MLIFSFQVRYNVVHDEGECSVFHLREVDEAAELLECAVKGFVEIMDCVVFLRGIRVFLVGIFVFGFAIQQCLGVLFLQRRLKLVLYLLFITSLQTDLLFLMLHEVLNVRHYGVDDRSILIQVENQSKVSSCMD